MDEMQLTTRQPGAAMMAAGTDDERILQTWLDTLDSPATRYNYEGDVRKGLDVVGGLAGCNDPERLAAWRRGLMNRLDAGELAPGSVARRLAAFRTFMKFCRIGGWVRISDEGVRLLLKSPRATVLKPYQILSDDEQRVLMEMVKDRPRERALLVLLLGAGLRAAEVVKLTVGSLFVDGFGNLIVHVKEGKGRKDRFVPLRHEHAVELHSYLAKRGLQIGNVKDKVSVLFLSRKGTNQAISPQHLWYIIQELVAEAGIAKSLSPHSFRHSYAMNKLRRGVPLPALQKLLGHATIATTSKYVDHLGLDDLIAAVNL